MEILSRTILVGRSFEPIRGRAFVEDGRSGSIEETETTSTDIAPPAFVNAHTHPDDSIAEEAAVGPSLNEAVAPPDGLKHRRLAAADRSDLVSAMRRTLRFITGTGTVSCLDSTGVRITRPRNGRTRDGHRHVESPVDVQGDGVHGERGRRDRPSGATDGDDGRRRGSLELTAVSSLPAGAQHSLSSTVTRTI